MTTSASCTRCCTKPFSVVTYAQEWRRQFLSSLPFTRFVELAQNISYTWEDLEDLQLLFTFSSFEVKYVCVSNFSFAHEPDFVDLRMVPYSLCYFKLIFPDFEKVSFSWNVFLFFYRYSWAGRIPCTTGTSAGLEIGCKCNSGTSYTYFRLVLGSIDASNSERKLSSAFSRSIKSTFLYTSPNSQISSKLRQD